MNLKKFFLNFFLINSTKLEPRLFSFLIFLPKKVKKNIGKAAPNEYPITAPIPPHVAADEGPNKIQAPKADATKLVVKVKKPTFLFAVR